MASRHQVECINKQDRDNPSERILYIGGTNQDGSRWRVSQPDAIDGIESGKWEFYVVKDRAEVDVVVAVSRYGNKYIKTETDGEDQNNLLSLPECRREIEVKDLHWFEVHEGVD